MIVLASLSASIGLSGYIERTKPALPESFADSDLSMNGSRLKGFALGMEGLLADWYWFRGLQYIGGKMLANRERGVDLEDLTSINPRLLYPMLQNATDLDPHFIGAYQYGAIVMPSIDKEKAIEFAKKGIANNPTRWRLYQHLGFIYWKLGRYEDAAATYQKGAEMPGASSFMELMAASMRSEGGSRSTARSIYRQMLADSTEEAVTITAERRLNELDWFDQRDAINGVLAIFKDQNGRCANSFGEIAGLLSQVSLPDGGHFQIDAGSRLVDPTEAPYVLDKETCTVQLDKEKTTLPIQKK